MDLSANHALLAVKAEEGHDTFADALLVIDHMSSLVYLSASDTNYFVPSLKSLRNLLVGTIS